MGRSIKLSVSSIQEVQDAITSLDTRLAELQLTRAENVLLREQVMSTLQNALFRLSGCSDGFELHMKNVARAGRGTVTISVDCPKRSFWQRLFCS